MRRPLILLFLLAFIQGALLAADAPALRDGDVREWKDGRPVHWQVGVGATTGEGPSSRVERGEEGGVRLAGDAATRTWSLVSQRLDTTTGTSYRLSFEVRVADVRREGGQSDNAYVGVRSSGEAGRPVVRIETPWRTAWTPAEVLFKGTSGGDEAVAFLSKSGSLEARRFVLEALAPKDSFGVLASNLGRYYAQFAARPDVDWPALVASHRAKFPADGNEKEFVAAATTMLAALKDLHVTIRTSDGRIVPTWTPEIPPNYDFRAVAKSLSDVRQIGKVAFSGRVGDDVGYVAIGSLVLTKADADALLAAFGAARTRRGLLVDLRANGGGDEAHATAMVGPLVDEPRVYARRRIRIGPDPTNLSDPFDVSIRPAGEAPYAGPIVVLIGPGCVSSGEGMAQMLRVLPNATFVGAPTRGASGNPQPADLPNGVTVSFSRWINELPDGTVFENRGVVPDVAVEFPATARTGDPVFDAGLRILRERLAR